MRARFLCAWSNALTTTALVSAVALGLLLTPNGAQATPQDLFGFGARTAGLGMTGASYVTGYESVFSNPAGLSRQRRRQLVFGMGAGAFQLELDGERFAELPMRGTAIGFTLPLPFGDVLEDRLVFGAGFWTPLDVVARGRIRFAQVPQFAVINRSQSTAVQVGLGFDFHGIVDGLRAGVAVTALASVLGSLDVFLDETNTFTSVTEAQLTTTFAPIVGVSYEQEEWGVGVNYRGELSNSFDFNIRTRDLPIELPVLTVGGLIQYDPHQLVLEGHYKPIPDLMIVANLTTRFWSAFPGLQVPTSSASFQPPAPEFSDMPSPRIGVEGTLRNRSVELQLRGGYAFEPTPAPAARLAPERNASGTVRTDSAGNPVLIPMRYIDNDRHVLTGGAGLSIRLGDNERLTLDLYGQLHLLAPRTHQVSRTDALGGDPMQSQGLIAVGGWTVGLEF